MGSGDKKRSCMRGGQQTEAGGSPEFGTHRDFHGKTEKREKHENRKQEKRKKKKVKGQVRHGAEIRRRPNVRSRNQSDFGGKSQTLGKGHLATGDSEVTLTYVVAHSLYAPSVTVSNSLHLASRLNSPTHPHPEFCT